MLARKRQHPAPSLSRGAWLALAVGTGVAAILQLDGTVVTVALPAVGGSLHASSAAVAWILVVYFLAYVVALAPGGRLVDRFGPRPAAMGGLGVFALGAVAGAVAPDFSLLVASRVVQGLGAGLASPAALAGAVAAFPPERRGTALGIWGAGSGMANLLGPLLGGILTEWIGWRASWWALVLLAAAAGLGARSLPGRAPVELVRPVDERGGRRIPTLGAAMAVAGLTFMVMIGAFFAAEQYLQVRAGYSPFRAAAAVLVVAAFVAVAAPVSGRLADARGERVPVRAGFALAGAAFLALGLPGIELRGAVLFPLLALVGLGLGLLFAPTSRAALNSVPRSQHGRISANLSASRLLGAAIGAALAGAALGGQVTGAGAHHVLLGSALLCGVAGVPLASGLPNRGRAGSREPESA